MERDERRDNALKYTPSNWTKLWPPMHQKNAINETLNMIYRDIIANGVTVNFHGQTLHFDCLTKDDLRVRWKFSDLGSCSGEFDHEANCIELDYKLKKDGLTLYETLYHEYTHKLQNALIAHMEEYDHDSAEYKYLFILQYEAKHKEVDGRAFGKDFFWG